MIKHSKFKSTLFGYLAKQMQYVGSGGAEGAISPTW